MQKFLTPSRSKRILADMKPLSDLLCEWRETLKLSPAEAARRCEMTRQQWWELESGRTTDPRSSTLYRLSEGTGIPIERLVAASCLPAPETPPSMKEHALAS
jgi:transcriptional regulator with XRE-family HTH domain